MDNAEMYNKTGDRKKDCFSFQKAFVPSHKQMLGSMMCDVLAHAYGKHANHYVIRRPVWVDGIKKFRSCEVYSRFLFQYGHVQVAHDSSSGIIRYGDAISMKEDPFGNDAAATEIYTSLKKDMFDSLTTKERVRESVYHTVEQEAHFGAMQTDWVSFEKKMDMALDKK